MRLFVGIPLSGSVISELTRLTERLHPAANLRWSAHESWHITLQFLGNASAAQYDCLIGALREVRCTRVPIQLGGLGVFEHAGILYAEVELNAQLVALQKKIVAATSLCGFMAETRPFRPHITLARSRGRADGRELRALKERIPSAPAFSRFTASAFLLYESQLSSTGSSYEVRQRFSLTDVS